MQTNEFKTDLIALLPKMRAYALALAGSKASGDDLLQETLLRAWRFRDRFTEGSNLSAWIHQIMRNTCYSAAKAQKRTVQDIDGLRAAGLSCEPDQEWSLRYGEMLGALQQLSLATREALLLVVGEGLSYEAAGIIAGCPSGTIKSRVNRARRHLAELTETNLSEFDRIAVRLTRRVVRQAPRQRIVEGTAISIEAHV